jgi:hypothetical protein
MLTNSAGSNSASSNSARAATVRAVTVRATFCHFRPSNVLALLRKLLSVRHTRRAFQGTSCSGFS